jgi:hypothetical protein
MKSSEPEALPKTLVSKAGKHRPRLAGIPRGFRGGRRMKRPAHSNPVTQAGDAGSIPAAATKYHVLYHNSRRVDLLYVPKSTRTPNVVFVRDVETKMCYLVEWYKLTHDPRTK